MDNSKQKILVDSDMSPEEALAQNPESPAPEEILSSLGLLEVKYWGFDNLLHQGQIVTHKDIIEDVKLFFGKALELNFPIKSIIPISKYGWNDERSCDNNNTSAYNYRVIAGTDNISKHAYGLAFDVNPVQNIYIKYDKELKEVFRFPKSAQYSAYNPGTLYSGHQLVTLMKSLGWTWGGDWTPETGRTDYQHLEKLLRN